MSESGEQTAKSNSQPEGPRQRGARRVLSAALILALPTVVFLVVGRLRSSAYLALLGSNFGVTPKLTNPDDLSTLLPLELPVAYLLGALPILLLVRVRALSPVAVLALGVAWVLGIFAAFHLKLSAPAFADIRANLPADLHPDPWILVPTLAMPFRSLARLTLPFLAGLHLAGRDFRLSRFALGFFVSALLIDALYFARSPLGFWPIAGAALLTALAMLPLMAPGERAALARFFGRDFGGDGETSQITTGDDSSLAFRALSLVVVALLMLIAALSAGLGFVERKVAKVLTEGPSRVHHSPSLVNAHDRLRELFTRGKSKDIDDMAGISGDALPNSFCGYVLPNSYTPELGTLAIKKASPEAISAYLDFFKPYFAAVEGARDADYFAYPGGAHPNFINIRAVSRALAFRSMVRLTEARAGEAARDIETLFRFGTVQRTDGTLVQYMIGTAVLGIGTNAAYEYYLWNRNSPEKLELLIGAMERVSPRVHRSFDIDMVRKAEPGLWPVMLYPEILAPGFTRAYSMYHLKWLEFDFVLVAMKLELYRAAKGTYPDSLDQLVPDYLERVPLDPLDGKAWIYKNLGTEFELNTPSHQQPETVAVYEKLKLVFPVSKVDDPKAREAVEAWTPAPYSRPAPKP